MKAHWLTASFIVLTLLLFSACNSTETPTGVSALTTPELVSVSPLSTDAPPPTVPALFVESGKGAVKGYLDIQKKEWKDEKLTLFFCPFTPDETGVNGVYILEPSIHPQTTLLNGYFQIGTLLPGQYVLVVGPMPENSVPLRDAGQIKVFDVQEGQILEISSTVP